MKKIALFASGSGSNVENIATYFSNDDRVVIDRVYCNKKGAFVLDRAKNLGIDTRVFSREEFYHSDVIVRELQEQKTDLIVLAGFLWLVPETLVSAFPKSIINIHPALLPNYGGKGMYGMNVHQAVIQAGDKESGITVHYVTPEYDKGDFVLQEKCIIEANDTPEDLAKKVHQLEYAFFPKAIECVLF
jgi:phosphoribosylglycinamide formyltransferase-1